MDMQNSTIGLVNPLIALIIAVTFLAIWQRDRARREVLALAAAFGLLAGGFIVWQVAPESRGRIIYNLANIPFFCGMFLIAWAVAKRSGRRIKPGLYWAVGAVMVVLFGLNHALNATPHVDLYVGNTAFGLLFMFAAQAASFTRKHSKIDALVFWMLVITSTQFLIRPSLIFMIEASISHDTYHDTIYFAVLNATAAINSLLMGMALIAASVLDIFREQQERAATDELTGLMARGTFENEVKKALIKAEHKQVPVALVIGDIDHFKQVNDIWGHQVGDEAITHFGQMVVRLTRDCDFAGRVGGEEFCVFIWDADKDVATRLAERLRVNTTYLEVGDSSLDVRLTASFGVAKHEPGENYHTLFGRADKALYRAKQNDRNCVVCAASPAEEAAAQLLASRSRPARSGYAA